MVFRLIQTRVVNRPGVLHRITQTILRPNYNIEQLTLSAIQGTDISLITVGVNFEDLDAAEHMVRQLAKQVDVLEARDITENF